MNTNQSLSTNEELQMPPSSGGCGWRAALCMVALILAFAAGSWFTGQTAPKPNSSTLITPKTSFEKPVIVHISGSVKKPGVYELPFNARIFEAIDKAGGLLPDAQTQTLNLADWVEDGSHIIVPSKSTFAALPDDAAPDDSAETLSLGLETQPTEPMSESTSTPKIQAPAKTSERRRESTSKQLPQTPIDLNRATSEELQQLPGIGPAMATRILEYRKQNHGFTSVDDLDAVRGIGPKTLEKIRPFVTVKPLPFQKSNN